MTPVHYLGRDPEDWEIIVRKRLAAFPALATPTQVAAFFNVSERTITRWISQGKMEANRHWLGGRWTISREEVGRVALSRLDEQSQADNRPEPSKEKDQ